MPEKPTPNHRFFVSGAADLALRGGGIGGEAHFGGKWVAYIRYSTYSFKPADQPANYNDGFIGTLLPIPGLVNKPREELGLFTLGTGRVLTSLGSRGWLAAKAGISFGNFTDASFIPNTQTSGNNSFGFGGGLPGPTHIVSYEKISATGAQIILDGQWSLAKWLAMGAGIEANFTGKKSLVSPFLVLSVGKTR